MTAIAAAALLTGCSGGSDGANPAATSGTADPEAFEIRAILETDALPCSTATPLPPSSLDGNEVRCDLSGAASYKLGPAVVTAADVADATVSSVPEYSLSIHGGGTPMPDGEQWVIDISLTDAGASAFHALTEAVLVNAPTTFTTNQPYASVALVSDGLVVSAPQINEPISSGQLQLSTDFTQAEAEAFAARLSS